MNINRAMSGNISIGLGLMLESVFNNIKNKIDDKRVIPETVDMSKYNYHMFNVLTLIREAVTSMSGNTHKPNTSEAIRRMNIVEYILKYKQEDILNIVIDDMNNIKSLYDDIETKPIVLFPDYSKIITILNKDKEIKDNKKLNEYALYVDLSKKLKNKKGLLVPIISIDKKTEYNATILLTSSYMLDFHLVQADLLETHTGKLKNKHMLNSKFKSIPNTDMTHIPFNITTHKIFGDNTLVKPLPISIRKEVIELSIKNKWNTHTNEEVIKQQIKLITKE